MILLLSSILMAEEPSINLENPQINSSKVILKIRPGLFSLTGPVAKKKRKNISGTQYQNSLDVSFDCILKGSQYKNHKPVDSKDYKKKKEYIKDCYGITLRNQSGNALAQNSLSVDSYIPYKMKRKRGKSRRPGATDVFMPNLDSSSIPNEIPRFGKIESSGETNIASLMGYAQKNSLSILYTKVSSPILGLIPSESDNYYLHDDLSNISIVQPYPEVDGIQIYKENATTEEITAIHQKLVQKYCKIEKNKKSYGRSYIFDCSGMPQVDISFSFSSGTKDSSSVIKTTAKLDLGDRNNYYDVLCSLAPDELVSYMSRDLKERVDISQVYDYGPTFLNDFLLLGEQLYANHCPEHLSAELVKKLEPITKEYLLSKKVSWKYLPTISTNLEERAKNRTKYMSKENQQKGCLNGGTAFKCDASKTIRLFVDMLSQKSMKEKEKFLIDIYNGKMNALNRKHKSSSKKLLSSKSELNITYQKLLKAFDMPNSSKSFALIKKNIINGLKENCTKKDSTYPMYMGFIFLEDAKDSLTTKEYKKWDRKCRSAFQSSISTQIKRACSYRGLEGWATNQSYIDVMGEKWSKNLLKKLKPLENKCRKQRNSNTNSCTSCSLKCQRKNARAWGASVVRMCESLCKCK